MIDEKTMDQRSRASRSTLRVLDLTDGLALTAGRLFVGLGTDVIRVTTIDESLNSPSALHWHSGKRIIRTADRRTMVDRFLPDADVVIESGDLSALITPPMRAAQAERWSRIVHVVVTPFGLTGPRCTWRGDDLIVSAAGGMAWLGGDPGTAPQPPPREQSAQLAGTHAVIAALLGLAERDRSGNGQCADISAQQVTAATLETGAISWIHGGTIPSRTSGVYAHVAHRIFSAAEGYLAGGYSGSNRMWTDLLDWMIEREAAEDLIDPIWSDQQLRWAGREHIDEVVARFAGMFDAKEFAHEARERALPWAEVIPATELRNNPQLAARQYFLNIDGVVDDVGFPFDSPGCPRPVRLAAPFDAIGAVTWHPQKQRSEPTVHRWSGSGDDSQPLSGLRILDLTWVLAGPYATKTLADYGAEILKIESRHRQDPTRFSTSMHLRDGATFDESGYFVNFNRNKQSVALNLRTQEGQHVLHRLVAECDVLVENYSPGVLAKWGLGFEQLKVLNPNIVLASMAGVGQLGPWHSAVTFADTLAAMSGLSFETGPVGGPPQGLTFGLGDMVAANAAVIGILDLVLRGEGGHLDLSQLEAMASHMGAAMLDEFPLVNPPGTHGIFPTQGDDRWIAISADDIADELISLQAVLGVATLSTVDIAAATVSWDAVDLATELQRVGVRSYPVQNGRDLVERDPQLAARDAYVKFEHPLLGAFAHEGVVIPLTRTPGAIRSPAPLLGQHTDEVLSRVLGINEQDLLVLKNRGALE